MGMATVKENLIAARALIDTPEKWGREEYEDEISGCLCVYGALTKATGNGNNWRAGELTAEAVAIIAALPDGWWGRSAALFNDDPSTTHADIMALLDRAIAAQDEVA